MKFLKHTILFLISSVLVVSCASYKSKLQTAAITFPELGSVVKAKGELWYASSKQVGLLNFEDPVLVTAKELPFNKATYKKYTNYLGNANRINSVAYTDSMPFKPKYIRLQLLDKIELTKLLNSDANVSVRSYLENDSNYKLVSAIDITITDELRPLLMGAERILLQKDTSNKLSLIIKGKLQNKVLDFSYLEVFDYSYVSFCWGEDRYHAKLIKALVEDNEGCPANTYSKASKVKSSTKSYLKL